MKRLACRGLRRATTRARVGRLNAGGLLPEIERAWVAIGTTLVLWDYRRSGDFAVYEGAWTALEEGSFVMRDKPDDDSILNSEHEVGVRTESRGPVSTIVEDVAEGSWRGD
jgi:hypothetical protein